jgi:hypothetical protein
MFGARLHSRRAPGAVTAAGPEVQVPTQVRCPSCRTLVPWEGNAVRPFCSERCRTLDLGGWLGERYRIPAAEPEETDAGATPGGGNGSDDGGRA